MDQKFQSSFIPKRQPSSIVARAKRPATIFYWLAMLLFILSILATTWLFVYDTFFLSKQLDQKRILIQEEIKAFDPDLTSTLTNIKTRIDSGQEILSKHISATNALNTIKSSTVSGIYFTDMELSFKPGDIASLKLTGEAPSYAVLAFQSEILNMSDVFLNPIFSGLDLNEQGRVIFKLESGLEFKAVYYNIPEDLIILEEEIIEDENKIEIESSLTDTPIEEGI